MYILKEHFINLHNNTFYFLIKINNTIYGLSQKNQCMCIYDNNNFEQIPIKRVYKKIIIYDYETKNALNHNFFAISNSSSSSNSNSFFLYKLDEQFNEIDSILFDCKINECKIDDIFYDNETGILYVLTQKQINKYNLNGDYLGLLISANKDTVYKAICAYDDLVFVAYNRNFSNFISILTTAGAFLTSITLDNEFTIKNMFVINKNNMTILRLFVTKRNFYQYFVDIYVKDSTEFENQNTLQDIEIECFCDDSEVDTTCFINE